MTQETPKNNSDKDDTPLSTWAIAVIPVYIGLMFIILFFPIAQDWAWIEAWLFIITFDANLSISFYLINKKSSWI